MKKILRLAAALLCTAAASSASAQAFPSKPVTIIVPFTAGGPTDTVARSLAQGMSKSLGQSVVVENTAGAGGTIASTRLKNAAPDGYTLLLHHIGMSTAPALYRKLAYNPQTDFEMVGMVVDTP
ncbi:MAG: tripartite tricarboxylate transporter substrate-binding protein, partial [Burkholderiaceae bacterium]